MVERCAAGGMKGIPCGVSQHCGDSTQCTRRIFFLPWSPCNSFRCATLVFSNEYDRTVGRSATMGKTAEGEVIFIKHYKCSKDFTLSICLFPSVSPSVCPYVHRFVDPSSVSQWVSESVSQSVPLSVCPSDCLSTYLTFARSLIWIQNIAWSMAKATKRTQGILTAFTTTRNALKCMKKTKLKENCFPTRCKNQH